MSLTREEILASSLPIQPVKTDWGEGFVRMMTMRERMEFETLIADKDDPYKMAATAVFTMCDENGKLLFTVDDIPALMEKNTRSIITIQAAAIKLNSLGGDGITASAEELKKTPVDSSLTD